MSIEKLKGAAEQIVGRVSQVRGRGEQATRQAMILPFLEALGYDIWNPAEVAPEFESDTAIKKAGQKEKVDYALIIDGQPRVFIEVKPTGESLDGHEGQLARYFNSTPSVSLAVITDGVEFRFYTDTGEPNIQDAAPFFVTRLDGADPQFDILMRFHKARFDAPAIRDFATELKYAAVFEVYLRGQLDLRAREPSEEFVRWVLTQTEAWSGRTTSAVVDRFRPVVKRSLVRVLREVVRRSVAALDEGVTQPEDLEVMQTTPSGDASGSETESTRPDQVPGGGEGGIVTTERELACFAVLKAIFESIPLEKRRYLDAAKRKVVDAELGYKDTTAYFGVFVNKPSNWVVRIFIETRTSHIGLPSADDATVALLPPGTDRLPSSAYSPLRIPIAAPEDLNRYASVLRATMLAQMA